MDNPGKSSSTAQLPTTSGVSQAQGISVGQPIDDLFVEIDYKIIEHFSQHLYSSPNKAVEELVSNAFDAFATVTHVYIPGSFTEGTVLVWDNGSSMDIEDLKRLWWIAQSPKEQLRDRVVTSTEGLEPRALIGKFGIGKLASYAVGGRIAHLCRRGDNFLLVQVNYTDVRHLEDNEKYKTPIRKLNESEAEAFVRSLFRDGANPSALPALWSQPHWTLAIIDNLRDPSKLTAGRLTWIIECGMPLRPDFRVWVNDREVQPKLGRDAGVKLSLEDALVQDRLKDAWAKAKADGEVGGDVAFDGVTATFPALGTVSALITIFERSQKERSNKEDPRSYGFFVMVRGRLLNPNDEYLFLAPPSFGTFYRCQFVIHADGLDEVLLADRERLRRDTSQAIEFAVLQRALYMVARDEVERRDNQANQRQRPESLLPVDSRPYFREPINTLLVQREIPQDNFSDIGATRIDLVAYAQDDPLAILDAGGAFHVNTAHPLYDSIHKHLGQGGPAKKAYQILNALAVSDVLLEGAMFDVGVPKVQIDRILRWRDGLFREVAKRFDDAPLDEVVQEVYQASYKGDRPFERALVKLFRQMGFQADHDGASKKWDGLVVAPIGQEDHRFTVEAKGSGGKVANDAAEVSGAAAHRVAANAKFAVIVAREFVGFARGKTDAAVLDECHASGDVSIATVEVLDELYKAVSTYHYPLEMVSSVLSTIESPEDKLKRVRGMRHPTEAFDYKGVLEAIWKRQQNEAKGDLVPYRATWQEGPEKWGVSFEDFERRLVALSQLAGDALLVVSSTSPEKVATLKQSPDVVAAHIASVVGAGV